MLRWSTSTSAPVIALALAFAFFFEKSLQAQQHPRDYRGIDARNFNPGRGNLVNGQYEMGPNAQPQSHDYIGPGNTGFGNFRTSGTPLYGQQGMYQQFGGVPANAESYGTYNHGHNFYGVGRSPNGVINYSTGQATPPMVPAAAFVGDPGVYGYGVGPFHQHWAGVNPFAFGYGTFQGGVNIDPWTGLPVLNSPWCASSLPYFGGVNPYIPGSFIVPTIYNINVQVRPTVRSTASYVLADPRHDFRQQIPANDPVPPAMNFNPAFPAIDEVRPNDGNIPDAPPIPEPIGAPLLNEFQAMPRADKVSSLAERINSLRYQSSGDESFRKEDYASAEMAYQSAIDMAPDRRAPWLRMAFAMIAQREFSKAAGYLKTGLMMPGDATRAWISSEELYGSRVAERSRTHGGDLWNWLAEQPLSADRLLLSGTFQKLRGHEKVATELLTMARHQGPEADCVDAVVNLVASDIGQRGVSHDLAQITQRGADKSPAGQKAGFAKQSGELGSTTVNSDGIVLRGKATNEDPSGDRIKPSATVEVDPPTETAPSASSVEVPPSPEEPPALTIPNF